MNYIITILAGVAAGFINTMAGGGSLITIPVLIFMGLPPAMANGTNRVAIMAQNITAVQTFRKKGYFEWKQGITYAVPAVVGSLIGANLAINMDPGVFNKMLSIIMVVVLGFILFQPHKRLEKLGKTFRSPLFGLVAFFLVGLYGGLVQAGVGFMIIAALTLLTDFTLVKINSLKVLIVLIYMSISLAVYVLSANVDWLMGITLAIGNATGAWLGSNAQIKGGDKVVRVILTVAILAMAVKLSGIVG